VQRYELHGTYKQPAVTVEDLTPKGDGTASFRVDSGTEWHGDLEGQTKLVMHGVTTLKTLANSGTIDEVFSGSATGLGSGQLHFSEKFSVDPNGVIAIDATVVGGTGALKGLHGSMHFAGKGDPVTGEGTGTYTAAFTR
jgi:hypothetical protein